MNKSQKAGSFSRRQFMGTITGAAAVALLKFDRAALAGDNTGHHMVTDYEGRLCYNENPLGPAPSAIAALIDQATMAHRYHDWFAESLRSRLATFHQVSSSQVICGGGATEILRLCAMAFTQSGRNIIAPYPAYTQFMGDAQLFGSNVIYTDLDDSYRVDLQAVLDEVDFNTTCICITNPNNPTGTVVNPADLVDFVNELPSGVVTLIDEAYYEYINDSQYPSAIEMVQQGKNVIVIKTFSKIYGLAGARIGYAVGPTSRINELKSYQYFATVSRPSLEAAKAALNDNLHVEDTVNLAAYCQNFCRREFEEIGLPNIPSTTNFFMVDVEDGDVMRSLLASRGIYVRSGWGMHRHIRVSCGLYDEMQDFIQALREIVLGVRSRKISLPSMPEMTDMFQAYPNPFNSSTTIRIFLPQTQNTKLEIFDINGRLVKRLVDGSLGAGEHGFTWHGTNESGRSVTSGLYFYRLTSGEDVITKRMMLVR
jgi:histidinol-phosphate aminotransferase